MAHKTFINNDNDILMPMARRAEIGICVDALHTLYAGAAIDGVIV